MRFLWLLNSNYLEFLLPITEEAFLATTFLGAAFFAVAFLAAVFFTTALLTVAFFCAAFFATTLFAIAFLGAAFFAATFFTTAFFAALVAADFLADMFILLTGTMVGTS